MYSITNDPLNEKNIAEKKEGDKGVSQEWTTISKNKSTMTVRRVTQHDLRREILPGPKSEPLLFRPNNIDPCILPHLESKRGKNKKICG